MDTLVLLPAVIHLYIFALESLFWNRPYTRRVFGVSSDEAEATRLLAWNQGFYNLMLAVAMIVGWCLRHGVPAFTDGRMAGTVLVFYGLISITVAGFVLLFSARRLWRSALIQIIPAFIGLSVLAL
jgi:putative membrane protein